jgi:hypothetical protein
MQRNRSKSRLLLWVPCPSRGGGDIPAAKIVVIIGKVVAVMLGAGVARFRSGRFIQLYRKCRSRTKGGGSAAQEPSGEEGQTGVIYFRLYQENISRQGNVMESVKDSENFGFRYVIVGMLFLAGILNYVDRMTLPIVAPLVAKELNFDPAEMGVIFSAFFLGYVLFCFVGGASADRFGVKRVYSWAMAVWSLFCGMTIVATGFTSLLVYRVIFGMGEGPMGSVTNKMIRDWIPRAEVGRALAFAPAIGNQIGAMAAGPLVALLVSAGGWRTPFIVVTLLGFVWLAAWAWLVSDTPATNRHISASERTLIESTRPGPANDSDTTIDPHGLGHYLGQPAVLAVAAVNAV